MSRKHKREKSDEFAEDLEQELQPIEPIARQFIDREEFERGEPLSTTDNRRWELESAPIIEEVLHALRREYRNTRGKWVSYGEPMLNEMGISDIESLILRPFLDKAIALSNLNDYEINTQIVNVLTSLCRLIADRYKEWDMNPKYRDAIANMVEGILKTQLNRARNGGERQYRAGAFGYVEKYDHDEIHPSEVGGGNYSDYEDDEANKREVIRE